MPLQIFEQRYIEMVTQSLKTNTGFVIVQLKQGLESHEVYGSKTPTKGQDVPFYLTGTQAVIVDFGQQPNGLLRITIEGKNRCLVTEPELSKSGLWLANNFDYPEKGELNPKQTDILKRLLSTISEIDGINLDIELSSVTDDQIMNYLIMLLAFAAPTKQALLETNSLGSRQQQLIALISNMNQNSNN